jgi:adenine-specific DNA-methyltransferase
VARIHDLIRQLAAQSPDLARDLAREVDVLSERRAFGLNFERHTPEEVELPGRPVRRGDKVHVLPRRGDTPTGENAVMWVVESIDRSADAATIARVDAKGATETHDVLLSELVVIAEFRDPIYPGLVSTGRVEHGGDKPYHSVINGENFHALQTLLFTHRGRVDAIYIDPPYNTGARDWKYNNHYVESDDHYRHSKWLAFMERRLVLAKELLNPEASVLIVTIDEKEYLRIGLLLEQTFPEARVQMVTSVISQNGTSRDDEFSRVDEYLYVLRFGAQRITRTNDNMLAASGKGVVSRIWFNFMRTSNARETREGQFYPIIADVSRRRIVRIGEPLGKGNPITDPLLGLGEVAIWPMRDDGGTATWGAVPDAAQRLLAEGFLRLGDFDTTTERWSVHYVRGGDRGRIMEGTIAIVGRRDDGSNELEYVDVTARKNFPKTVWNRTAHDATAHGTRLLKALLPGRKFPFPKSLYAVEDSLRFFVADKPDALILDFFSGSGTTTHAVFRLNKQDGGRRVSISVTNNEVSADEQKGLHEQGLRPGDPEWERWGICEEITKPRIEAAITGKTPDGEPIKGDYKFTDVFALTDGFAENVEFFTLTYEAPLRVASHRDFPKIAPLLWLRAGSTGRRIESLDVGWDVADTYGVLADLDKSDEFLSAVAAAPDLRFAFIVTDEDRLFEAIVRDLSDHVEPVRMYDAYLRNFELESRVPW